MRRGRSKLEDEKEAKAVAIRVATEISDEGEDAIGTEDVEDDGRRGDTFRFFKLQSIADEERERRMAEYKEAQNKKEEEQKALEEWESNNRRKRKTVIKVGVALLSAIILIIVFLFLNRK